MEPMDATPADSRPNGLPDTPARRALFDEIARLEALRGAEMSPDGLAGLDTWMRSGGYTQASARVSAADPDLAD
jgi:hypothetical protein